MVSSSNLMRRILGTILVYHLQASVLIVASLSSPNNNGIRGIEQETHRRLLPAKTRVHFKFSTSKEIGRSSFPEEEDLQQQQLVLHRRDGIDLYGREIVHTRHDARSATMSVLCTNAVTERPLEDSSMWDATLVLRPENLEMHNGGDADSLLLTSTLGDSKSCFVAMNRFHVKEDCKALFEERWAQRQSKLPCQPGFVGFSLLRKTATDMDESQEHDRFNYSTCTIWDSIDCWEEWRNGGGKTSHEASRETSAEKKRVPVSEWLEGPSSPIFWDGNNQKFSKRDFVSDEQ